MKESNRSKVKKWVKDNAFFIAGEVVSITLIGTGFYIAGSALYKLGYQVGTKDTRVSYARIIPEAIDDAAMLGSLATFEVIKEADPGVADAMLKVAEEHELNALQKFHSYPIIMYLTKACEEAAEK